MPELAEVDYFRRQWDGGRGKKVRRLALHAGKRPFRGVPANALKKHLTGATLLDSVSHGKQMLFRFSQGGWLGLHLGMTGELRVEPSFFQPTPHDHLVLYLDRCALIYRDPRQFGRVRFHVGEQPPEWWSNLPPSLVSPGFTRRCMAQFVQRHGRAPVKAVLLLQRGFPGIGNWMADEILWRAKVHPRLAAGRLSPVQLKTLWRAVRWVARGALKIMAKDFSDPPGSWLFVHRWKKDGHCPKDGTPLARGTVGGRTTAWCPHCQQMACAVGGRLTAFAALCLFISIPN